MSETRVVYRPHPSVTPEEARDLRARALRFALDCYAKKKGGVPSTADDRKGFKDDPATNRIPQ